MLANCDTFDFYAMTMNFPWLILTNTETRNTKLFTLGPNYHIYCSYWSGLMQIPCFGVHHYNHYNISHCIISIRKNIHWNHALHHLNWACIEVTLHYTFNQRYMTSSSVLNVPLFIYSPAIHGKYIEYKNIFANSKIIDARYSSENLTPFVGGYDKRIWFNAIQ